MVIFLSILWSIFILFLIFLFLLQNKINILNKYIYDLFSEKNNLIPSIYDVTKKQLTKHDEIFHHILDLRTQDFWENNVAHDIVHKMKTYEQIHSELNFIFKVANKHPKLLKNERFLFVRDLIIEKSYSISQKLELYKTISKKFNKLVTIKNYSIIGLFIPISKIENI